MDRNSRQPCWHLFPFLFWISYLSITLKIGQRYAHPTFKCAKMLHIAVLTQEAETGSREESLARWMRIASGFVLRALPCSYLSIDVFSMGGNWRSHTESHPDRLNCTFSLVKLWLSLPAMLPLSLLSYFWLSRQTRPSHSRRSTSVSLNYGCRFPSKKDEACLMNVWNGVKMRFRHNLFNHGEARLSRVSVYARSVISNSPLDIIMVVEMQSPTRDTSLMCRSLRLLLL